MECDRAPCRFVGASMRGGVVGGMGWRSAPGGWGVGRVAQLCGCVNGGCEGEAVPDYQADNTRRAPDPLGSRPRFLGGRLFAGMTIEAAGMTVEAA